VSEFVPVCRHVTIALPRDALPSVVPGTLYGQRVQVGSSIAGGTVVLCNPNPCIIGHLTSINYVKQVKYSVEELKHNVAVTVDYGDTKDLYVYPKRTWRTIEETVVKPLAEGRMHKQGVVLYGPPGTGKTSMARILSDVNALPMIELRVEEILSMWQGMSEKNLANKLLEAEHTEPSLVFADEAEWLLSRVRFAASAHEASTASTVANLVRIILRTVERWNRQKRRILFVAATNVPPSMLDKALLRSGRLGEPVYIPLPDYEAVLEFLVRSGVDKSVAERWAVKVVNLGLSMADVKLRLLPELLNGREPELEPQREEGYRRYVVDIKDEKIYDDLVKKLFNAIEERYRICVSVEERSRHGVQTLVWFATHFPVATAVANAFFSYRCKMPTVTLTDPRRIDAAIEAAVSLRAALIVPSSLHPDLIQAVRDEAQTIVFAGLETPKLPFGEEPLTIRISGSFNPSTRESNLSSREVFMALAAVVFSFYGIRYTMQDLQRLDIESDREGFLKKLALAGAYGAEVSDLVRRF